MTQPSGQPIHRSVSEMPERQEVSGTLNLNEDGRTEDALGSGGNPSRPEIPRPVHEVFRGS